MKTVLRWIPGVVFMLGACGAGEGGTPPPSPPSGSCAAVTEEAPEDGAAHLAQGTAITWRTNPPARGSHYPVWAPWAQPFTEPVPRGNWLHNTEHGGVALLYRCPQGCDDVVAGLRALAEALPQDPSCARPINARWVLTPDPLLPEGVQVAAAAWGHAYRAACLDAASLSSFVSAHYAQAPEDLCNDGAITWR